MAKRLSPERRTGENLKVKKPLKPGRNRNGLRLGFDPNNRPLRVRDTKAHQRRKRR